MVTPFSVDALALSDNVILRFDAELPFQLKGVSAPLTKMVKPLNSVV